MTARRGGTLCGMELSWTVRGGYANWTLTVSTAPPDHGEEHDWPATPFTQLLTHFRTVVDLLEAVHELEHDSISACTLTTLPSPCG